MVDTLLGCARDERTATAATDPSHAQRRTWRWRGRWSERRFHRRALPEPGHVETKPDTSPMCGRPGWTMLLIDWGWPKLGGA